MSIRTDHARVSPAACEVGVPAARGEAVGLLIAPLAPALICAMPVLVAGSPVGAACLAVLYLAVLGIAPNVALGRVLLARVKARRPLSLGVCIAGGALIKMAVVILLTVIGPPVVLVFDPEGRLFGRWSEMAMVGAWASPLAVALGAVEGAVFCVVARRLDGRLALTRSAGRS